MTARCILCNETIRKLHFTGFQIYAAVFILYNFSTVHPERCAVPDKHSKSCIGRNGAAFHFKYSCFYLRPVCNTNTVSIVFGNRTAFHCKFGSFSCNIYPGSVVCCCAVLANRTAFQNGFPIYEQTAAAANVWLLRNNAQSSASLYDFAGFCLTVVLKDQMGIFFHGDYTAGASFQNTAEQIEGDPGSARNNNRFPTVPDHPDCAFFAV